jgi:hypothetical protein
MVVSSKPECDHFKGKNEMDHFELELANLRALKSIT